MANLFKPTVFNNLVASLTIVTFTTPVIYPPQVHAAGINWDLGAINFGIKIEKLFGKLERAIDKGKTNKIVGYMFDIKTEVEQYTGNKIDIDKQVNQAQKEAKAKGQKIDNRHIKQIKKEFHRLGKKQKHRDVWFTQCTEMGIPYSLMEADLNFDMNYAMAKSTKGHDDEDIDVPIPIMVGVTVSLCGLFLVCVPIPACQSAGIWLINTGVGILGSEAIQKWDLYDKKQREE